MTVRTFVDSNILIYAHDADAGFRQRRASEQLVELWAAGLGLLSTQVLQEFYVNVTRKIKTPLTPSVAREVVRDYALWVESPIIRWKSAAIWTAVRTADTGHRGESFRNRRNLAVVVLGRHDPGSRGAESRRPAADRRSESHHGARIAGIEIVDPFR
jgi:predicted nucleic acid-binding protein